jgi:hypothetical protein
MHGEVNRVDLLLIEAIRSFFPEVYDIIRENQTVFHGTESATYGTPKFQITQLLKPIMDNLSQSEQEQLKVILVELFPRLAPEYSMGGIRSGEWLESYAKDKKICSPEYCPRYFSYSIPRSDVADRVIEEIIELAVNGEEEKLIGLIETNMEPGRARKFISKLRIMEGEFDPKAVRSICNAIASHAYLLPNTQGFMDFENPPMQAGILISHLIRRHKAEDIRYELAVEVIKNSEPLWFASEILRWLYVTDESNESEQNTLTAEKIKALRKLMIDRVKAASAAGSPLFDPDVSQEAYLLTEWAAEEGRDAVQRHLQSIFEKDTKQVARFLESMGSKSWSLSDGLPSPPTIMADQFRQIATLFDPEILTQIVIGTCRGNFDNPNKHPDPSLPLSERLAEQFIYAAKQSKAPPTE